MSARLLLLAAGCLLALLPARATTFIAEAEELAIPGGWSVSSGTNAVRKFLVASAGRKAMPAAGAIDVPHAGAWKLWVRAKDYPDYLPGTRTFSVRLGDTKSAAVFGRHGRRASDGWAWEDGGTFTLPAGPVLLVLGDECAPHARCDAILLTDNMGYKPDGAPAGLHKASAKLLPTALATESRNVFLPPALTTIETGSVATIGNDLLRISFHTAATAGGPAIAMKAEHRSGDGWRAWPEDPNAEGYRVLYRPMDSDPKVPADFVRLSWDASLAPELTYTAGGAAVSTRPARATGPWQSAECAAVRPVIARQIDERTVSLDFAPLPRGRLTATWRMATNRPHAEVALRFVPSGPGQFSLGYHGPLAVPPGETDFMLLPFLFHGRRFPAEPAMLPSSVTPTPMALVNRGGVSCAVVAGPSDIGFEWPGATNSRFALGLRNEAGLAQPLLYSPVLGQRGCASDGRPVEARLHLWIQPGGWFETYRDVAEDLFGLRDYRSPVAASLSDTALNLLDLLRDAKASGWNAKAKGPWNIESLNVVTHSSPLVYLSYYLLTGDASFYDDRARPALEYLLSRPGPHFGAERAIGDNYYRHQPMRGPGNFYGAAVFASAQAMTHGRSPAFGELCRDAKGVRFTHSNAHVRPFDDLLALHELTGEARWLEEAVAEADRYVAANIATLPARDPGDTPFVNVTFIPAWEGLLRLHEATGERRFLDAAAEGARWLMTTLWTQPVIPAGDTTIHPGGWHDHARHIWWMGDRLFRLGLYDEPASTNRVKLPPIALPERRVPAWQVSNVGLGLEQPCTYTRRSTHANITMSIWAPNFLRLAGLAQDTSFRTAARNATIGRFASYPGYYIDGPTDHYQRPDYPINGPDVTSLYVHHIPPFAAYVLDYLFTEVETRSRGAVRFPSTRQCGYVWFDSRLYGHAPGRVHGSTAWPWLHRTAARSGNRNVDCVLAEGDGRFHVLLLNQARDAQRTRVTFDEKALGRSLTGARVALRVGNEERGQLAVEANAVEIEMAPLGIATLTLEGVRIDVPTHRVAPPAHLALPARAAIARSPHGASGLEAVGMVLQAPPFERRDLFVYVTAGIDDCRSATLRIRTGEAPDTEVRDDAFPWEFSVPLAAGSAPIRWSVEVEKSDGTVVAFEPSACE